MSGRRRGRRQGWERERNRDGEKRKIERETGMGEKDRRRQ